MNKDQLQALEELKMSCIRLAVTWEQMMKELQEATDQGELKQMEDLETFEAYQQDLDNMVQKALVFGLKSV